MPVNIHGKSYNTVAERIISAGKDLLSVETEVISHDPVVIKATVTVSKETRSLMSGVTGQSEYGRNDCKFTGISAANPSKTMEKESPYEVAETSAVGRALAFAGYETTNGIASAEEVNKAISSPLSTPQTASSESYGLCPKCGAKNRKSMAGKIYCSDKCWLPENQHLQTISQAGAETPDF